MFGIKRWPFCKINSLNQLTCNVQADISRGDQNHTLVMSLEELVEQKRKMESCASLDLNAYFERLQQVPRNRR